MKSGIYNRLFFAPSESFAPFLLPGDSHVFEGKELPLTIQMKPGKRLWWIDVLVDTGKLRINAEGSARQKRFVGSLDFWVVGLEEDNYKLLHAVRNTPLICFVVDNSETVWVLGNHRNRAFLNQVDFTSGKRYEDFVGAIAKVNYKSATLTYPFDLEELYEDEITRLGDFNDDYNLDFLI